ncbi:GRIA1 [Branchiostoma lanceolatum]|uniref:GRIA1 protein n=1 Tax=Branchiostoma lanceolatum TaxID=7740 RepID=A0A8J9ZET6_BRALA|nr:GRIA1 [Branchiostoma lanceolatum]
MRILELLVFLPCLLIAELSFNQTTNQTPSSWHGATRKPTPLLIAKLMATTQPSEQERQSLKGMHLRAVTIEEEPYVMVNKLGGKAKFTGFVIDIITALAAELGFTFDLYLVPDGTYGSLDANKSWGGLIGEVMRKKADVAVAPVTISSAREQVVDFTNPFMDLGAGLLIRKPEPKGTSLFAFLLPFNSRVWFSILGALIGTAILLYITSRIRYKCNVGDPNYDNDVKFNMKNSLWLTYWSIVRKGGEPAPRSLPSRILAGAWWFFTLIVISTYTANLTAFLTVKRLVTPIKSIDDLSSQTNIRYSATYGTFLYDFFKGQVGTGSIYERMWYNMKMENHKHVSKFPNSSKQGLEWVRQGGYVLIEETPFLEYAVRTDDNCDLMLLGKPFLFKGYGFATRRLSWLKKPLSVGILKLQETGKMDELRNRWWPKDGCPLDGEAADVNTASALGIDIFLGVFYVLGGAALLAVLVTLVQIIYVKLCKSKPQPEENDKKKEVHFAPMKNNMLRRQTTELNLH